MKRVLTLCLIIGITAMFAKVNAKGKGIRAGWQHSYLSLNDTKLTGKSDGFYVGFFNTKDIVPLLDWQSGFEYYQVKGETTGLEMQIHYLSIPLSLRLKLGPVYALGGVNGAVRIADNLDLGAGLIDIPGVSKDISRFDAGAHLGVGFKFLMLGVEARYNWGLVDVYESMNTEYIQVGACLFF